jgi:hypothetical protein
MSLKSRLSKIESYRPVLKYPLAIEMPMTESKATYDKWLLDNNTGLTQAMIEELDIKHLEYFYAE